MMWCHSLAIGKCMVSRNNVLDPSPNRSGHSYRMTLFRNRFKDGVPLTTSQKSLTHCVAQRQRKLYVILCWN